MSTEAPYLTSLGIRVEDVTAERARLRVPYADANSNPGRALHGGVYASAIDVAGTLAARAGVETAAAPEARTLDLSVCYLAAAIGEDVTAEARVLRRGKELAYVAVDVRNDAGKALATGLVTHRMASPGPSDRQLRAVPPYAPVAAPTAPKLARALVAVPFIAGRGMRIAHMHEGRAIVEMPWKAENADAAAAVHEGALAALLDTAGAMASWSLVGLDFRLKASTVGIHVSFQAPARSEDVVADARTIGRTDESFSNVVVVYGVGSGRAVATGSVTYRIVVPT
jgi:acyl-CoA thioesterase